MEKEAVKVAFRADKFGDFKGVVTAVFSGVIDGPRGELMCYAHMGQHSYCHRDWYTQRTRPATPEEYRELLTELESVGYEVTTVQRVTWA